MIDDVNATMVTMHVPNIQNVSPVADCLVNAHMTLKHSKTVKSLKTVMNTANVTTVSINARHTLEVP